ncbi:MAG: hypothetical protein GY714_15805 [Desulfobacterales bacterium]|nr:hypothetical protein [Desulfobacterales bacterium]
MSDYKKFTVVGKIIKNAIVKAKYIRNAIHENRANKYITCKQAICNYFKYRNIDYEKYNIKSVKKFKKSDTLFITGAGPSLNLLNEEHLKTISKHDSFGINYSFIKKGITPTYLQISYENDWGLKYMINALEKRKKELNNTIFFLHDKCLFRMAHPRTTPYFFSEKPKCCFYKLPEIISLEKNRPFLSSDFDRSLFYRGTLTLILELAIRLEYKKIVLLGIDPDKLSYFFDGYDEMNEYTEKLMKIWKKKGINVYENMIPKGKRYHTIDIYLESLREYLIQKKNVSLQIGFKNDIFPEFKTFFN